MLSHRSSAATRRTSQIRTAEARRSPIRRSACSAGTACSAGSRYSDWSSSPALGVKSGRKCGSRSNHGPGTPSCSVQESAATPGTGFRAAGAGVAVNHGSTVTGEAGVTDGAWCGGWGACGGWGVWVVFDEALDPELGQAGGAPVGEHAHAVAAGHDRGEVVVQHRQRQVLVDPLGDLEGRHDVQDQAGDHAEGAQVHDGTGEGLVRRTGELHHVAVGGDQFQAGDRGGQGLVGGPGAVGAGGDGAGHRDVRQRRHVAQRQALPVQAGGQGGVAQARPSPGPARRPSRSPPRAAGRPG